ncbi:MAG: DUF4347 domain-containing protein, partial [Desulfamplus sp.]|nr:DUF4347 domain-containing protein [Desulfamplus sp.]
MSSNTIKPSNTNNNVDISASELSVPSQILFIDSNIPDAKTILSSINPLTKIVWLTSDQSPLLQIAHALE